MVTGLTKQEHDADNDDRIYKMAIGFTKQEHDDDNDERI